MTSVLLRGREKAKFFCRHHEGEMQIKGAGLKTPYAICTLAQGPSIMSACLLGAVHKYGFLTPLCLHLVGPDWVLNSLTMV